MPSDYRLLTMRVPNEADVERLDTVPRGEAACVRIGEDFLLRGEALALSVPSAIVPQERNLLINPRHMGVSASRGSQAGAFRLRPRLIG